MFKLSIFHCVQIVPSFTVFKLLIFCYLQIASSFAEFRLSHSSLCSNCPIRRRIQIIPSFAVVFKLSRLVLCSDCPSFWGCAHIAPFFTVLKLFNTSPRLNCPILRCTLIVAPFTVLRLFQLLPSLYRPIRHCDHNYCSSLLCAHFSPSFAGFHCSPYSDCLILRSAQFITPPPFAVFKLSHPWMCPDCSTLCCA